MLVDEIRAHLTEEIIPFWKALKDEEYGGYYGYMDYNLEIDREAVKGCILNSRITWFFANAYTLLREDALLAEARHGYEFLKNKCYDKENGGILWSLNYDGTVSDSTKHTYNQAFAIYALASYYEASGDEEALALAVELFHLIEERCRDEVGYEEAFDISFQRISNDKLSENGIIADKTMNTLLHVFEAYTELYRVAGLPEVKTKLTWIMDTFADKVYNPRLHRQEVFFDKEMNSILDLHSYGHDIETAWLIDRGVEIVNEKEYEEKMLPITRNLTAQIYQTAFDGASLANECENGVVDTTRVWWVQAETVVGFLNGWQQNPEKSQYLQAVKDTWNYIRTRVIDKRKGSEWYAELDAAGEPIAGKPIVEPWKCPYHNGRMCMEIIRRSSYVSEKL
mgnify:CR=1 FL=1